MKLTDLMEQMHSDRTETYTVTLHDFDEEKSVDLPIVVRFTFDDGYDEHPDRPAAAPGKGYGAGYVVDGMKAGKDVAIADLKIKKGSWIDERDIVEYMEDKDYHKFAKWLEEYEG